MADGTSPLRSLDAENSTPPDLLHGGWYTTEELAELLGVDPSSLRRWRTSKPMQGPPFVQFSAGVMKYSAHDVETWLRQRRVEPGKAA